MISDTTLDTFIRVWKLARLNKGADSLTYPSTNVLHPEHGLGQNGPILSQAMEDAERVQVIVTWMPPDMREAFETYHLGVMKGDVRDTKERKKWKVLGCSRSTYFRRARTGREFIRRGLAFWD